MPNAWITLDTFDSLPLAELARIRLDQAGIRCRLLNAEVFSMNPLLGNAVGYIPLQVAEEDLETAAEVVGRDIHVPLAGGECERCGEPLDDDGPCPMCGHARSAVEAADHLPVQALGKDVDDADEEQEDPWGRDRGDARAMDQLRSWRRPIILLFLAPMLVGVLGLAIGVVQLIMDRLLGNG